MMSVTMTQDAPPSAIILAPYNPEWPRLFEEERARLQESIGEWALAIEHVGSTAIPGIAAKPIIDIGVALRRFEDALHCITPLVESGWQCMGEFGIPGRIFFRKLTDEPLAGQTQGGRVGRSHHIHMYEVTHEQFAGHVTFRDYLRAHPEAVREYEALKQDLARKHAGDVEAYAVAKSDFVRSIWSRAGRGDQVDPGPVTIAGYNPLWPEMYAAERERISRVMGDWLVGIEHVGSTSVPGLGAKPVIDIMPLVRSLADDKHFVPLLESVGYEHVPPGVDDIPERRYFRRGFPRMFHVHVVERDSEFAVRHLAFRDYLRTHPESAREYEALKRRLAAEQGADRLGYVNAKTEFITGIERLAMQGEAA